MSRIAKNPVVVPAGVEVTLSTGQVSVKGPLGMLTRVVPGEVAIERIEDRLQFKATSRSIHSRAMSGTMRALVANMVYGVTKGFERKLSLVGVGYRAQAQGDKVNLTLGYSHPVAHAVPKGIKVETPTQTEILVKGADKQQVGLVAAQIRAYREPDAYKGKGLRYSDEVVVLKETKKK